MIFPSLPLRDFFCSILMPFVLQQTLLLSHATPQLASLFSLFHLALAHFPFAASSAFFAAPPRPLTTFLGAHWISLCAQIVLVFKLKARDCFYACGRPSCSLAPCAATVPSVFCFPFFLFFFCCCRSCQRVCWCACDVFVLSDVLCLPAYPVACETQPVEHFQQDSLGLGSARLSMSSSGALSRSRERISLLLLSLLFGCCLAHV